MPIASLIAEGDDLILPLSTSVCDQLNWKPGDVVGWTDHGDGSFSLTKREPVIKTVKVLVETVQLVKRTYFVDVDKNHPEWAIDTVVCRETPPKLTEQIDEVVIGHRVVSDVEYTKMIGDCDE